MDNGDPEPMRLELDPAGDLIAGRLTDGSRVVSFAGWLELTALLEAAWLLRRGNGPEAGPPPEGPEKE